MIIRACLCVVQIWFTSVQTTVQTTFLFLFLYLFLSFSFSLFLFFSFSLFSLSLSLSLSFPVAIQRPYFSTLSLNIPPLKHLPRNLHASVAPCTSLVRRFQSCSWAWLNHIVPYCSWVRHPAPSLSCLLCHENARSEEGLCARKVDGYWEGNWNVLKLLKTMAEDRAGQSVPPQALQLQPAQLPLQKGSNQNIHVCMKLYDTAWHCITLHLFLYLALRELVKPDYCCTRCNMRGIGIVFGVFSSLLTFKPLILCQILTYVRILFHLFLQPGDTDWHGPSRAYQPRPHNTICDNVIPISWQSTAIPGHFTSQNSSRARLADLKHGRDE